MSDLRATCVSIAEELEGYYENEDFDAIQDYLSEVLDVEITTNLRHEYLGATICVTLGGPNIYINTRYNKIEGYWGGEQVEIPIDNDLSGYIYDYYEEAFEMY